MVNRQWQNIVLQLIAGIINWPSLEISDFSQWE